MATDTKARLFMLEGEFHVQDNTCWCNCFVDEYKNRSHYLVFDKGINCCLLGKMKKEVRV